MEFFHRSICFYFLTDLIYLCIYNYIKSYRPWYKELTYSSIIINRSTASDNPQLYCVVSRQNNSFVLSVIKRAISVIDSQSCIYSFYRLQLLFTYVMFILKCMYLSFLSGYKLRYILQCTAQKYNIKSITIMLERNYELCCHLLLMILWHQVGTEFYY